MAQTRQEAGSIQAPPPGKYELDKAHTMVEFAARHMLTKVRGRFTEFEGTIEVGEKPENSQVDVEIRVASIQTNDERRDAHMRSGDFFELETYPLITFHSTAIRPTGGSSFDLEGELTVKDVTRPVTLKGEYLGSGPGMGEGSTLLAATARTRVDREDWGMTWNMVMETGGFLVSRDVDIEIEVEAHKVG
jgi:polyisoprenoid-binding protein YceI